MSKTTQMPEQIRDYSSRLCDENSPEYDYGVLFYQEIGTVDSLRVLLTQHMFYKRGKGGKVWHKQDGEVQEICAAKGTTRYYVMLDVEDYSGRRLSDWNVFFCRNQHGASAGILANGSPFNSADTALLANGDGLQRARVRKEKFEDYNGEGRRIKVKRRVIRIRRRIFLAGSFRFTASWRLPEDGNPRLISDPEMEVSLKPF